jgi:hypothetical protein
MGRKASLVGGALVLALVSAAALWFSSVGPADDGPTPSAAGFSLEQARAFEEFPLYYAGQRADGDRLVAVLRRNDTANYVSFVYGDCAAGDDRGCTPPAEIQVWPSCLRNLGLYEPAAPATDATLPERATLRGVPAAFLEGATRLEIETDRATVVVFAHSRARLLRIAAALRALDAAVAPGEPLPPPGLGPRGEGVALDC